MTDLFNSLSGYFDPKRNKNIDTKNSMYQVNKQYSEYKERLSAEKALLEWSEENDKIYDMTSTEQVRLMLIDFAVFFGTRVKGGKL